MHLEIQESLKRKLDGTKAKFDQHDVEDYFQTIIVPCLKEAEITRFSILLYSCRKEICITELWANFLAESAPYLQLVDALQIIGSNFAGFSTNDNSRVAAYAENDLDWVILKYEAKDADFIEPIIVAFWSPFYEFA